MSGSPEATQTRGVTASPDGLKSTVARRSLSSSDLKAPSTIGLFFLAMLLLGLAVVCFPGTGNTPIAFMWGLACLAFGGLIGFLFVISDGVRPAGFLNPGGSCVVLRPGCAQRARHAEPGTALESSLHPKTPSVS